MVDKANIEQSNSYDNHFEGKIASNSLIVESGNFLKLFNGFIYLAWPFDPIEWVSETSAVYPFDNQTNAQGVILYRISRAVDLYEVNVSNWVVNQNQVWNFFMIDLDQKLDASTASATQGQLRLEEIIAGWTKALVRIITTFWWPAGAMWPTGFTGPQWSTGITWATGVNGATGIQWPTGATWPVASTGATWPQWPSGTAGAVGATWATGLKWLQREWTWSWATSYDIDDAIFYNWNAYVSLQNGNINNTPPPYPSWVNAFWSILAQQWATGPSWLPWSPGWATGATGATGAWATGATGPAWVGSTGATGPQGPQWVAGDFTDEYVEYFKGSDQVYSVPWSSEAAVFVTFSNFIGNGSMSVWGLWYMQTISAGTFEVSQEIKTVTQDNAGNNWVTAVRNLLVVTNNLWTVNYLKTGICDDKWEDQFTNNSIRTYTLSATALIDLNSGDRIYCVSTSSCATATNWDVVVKGPSMFQFSWLWFYAWSKMWMRKIHN